MARRRLIWTIYPAFLGITVLSVAAVAWYAEVQFRRFYLAETVATLTARARLVESYLEYTEGFGDSSRADAVCKEAGARSGVRITVIGPDGAVTGDTERAPGEMDNHGDRPEVRSALAGRTDWEIRHSDTLDEEMVYLAVPVERGGRVAGVVRVSISLGSFESAVAGVRARVALGGLCGVIVASAVSWLVSKRIARPLERLRRGVERLSAGEPGRKLPVPDSEEMGALAEAMNAMAAGLGERMRTIGAQQSELEAVFDGMSEGVLAVDGEERVVQMNRAAEGILGVRAGEAKGRFVQEVARNPALQSFVRSALEGAGPVEGEITWHGAEDRVFEARGTRLTDAGGRASGALVVLNEVTRVQRLERVRRDFVANVSHEMQTPITSIYGYAETLLEKGSRTEEMTERAASAIVRQAGRLSALVEDLLALSRIEKQAEAREIALARGSVKAVVAGAVETCQARAAERGVTIALVCEGDVEAKMNAELLERAVVNLVDNATKYSERGQTVAVECGVAGGEAFIRVRDEGCGIGAEHLGRLFERFYRVDRARSRSMGGTGLGLAIVKHIVLAHGGRVWVESEVGRGSVFTIALPLAPEAG